jgi:hypothetical protein
VNDWRLSHVPESPGPGERKQEKGGAWQVFWNASLQRTWTYRNVHCVEHFQFTCFRYFDYTTQWPFKETDKQPDSHSK